MDTLLDATDRLRTRGFSNDFRATATGLLRCLQGGSEHDPGIMRIEEVVRYEGASDPNDQAIMLALSCECGRKGLYSAAFGLIPQRPMSWCSIAFRLAEATELGGRRLDVKPETALGPAWILGDELVDDSVGALGDSLSHAEVQRTHGVGIGQCGGRERTGVQDDVDALASTTNLRVEAEPRHRVGQVGDGVLRILGSVAVLLACSPTDFLRGVARADDLGQ
jgi:hypothetical protein